MAKDKLRPNAQEYLQQMQDLRNQIQKLDMIVTTRLYTLCAQYPQAPIQVLIDDNAPQFGSVEIKAKSLIPATMGKGIIKDMPYETRIMYIETIEKWLADQHPHKQKEIEFPKITVVPESPVGERVLINGNTGEKFTRNPPIFDSMRKMREDEEKFH